MIQANCHCGGAEIAGDRLPGWVACLGGVLKRVSMTNLRFIDDMA
jgi:anaerobic magnesium-protoporphyrin IX monomethyl ester cyclase